MPDFSTTPAYLGDGVYVSLEPGHVRLQTMNGTETTNTVYFDTETLMAFRRWLRAHIDHQRGDRDPADTSTPSAP